MEYLKLKSISGYSACYFSNENLKFSLSFGSVRKIVAEVRYTLDPVDSGFFSPLTTILTL